MTENGNGKNGSSWTEYRKLVLANIETLTEAVKELKKDIGEMQVIIAKLETSLSIKSGIWGAIAGLIPAIGLLIYFIVKK